MTKKSFLVGAIALMMSSAAMNAQVGVNTDNPKATLDVMGKPSDVTVADGFIAPRITGNQLKAKDALYGTDQIGAVIYATAAASPVSTKTANVTAAGYYYFNGTVWLSLTGVGSGTSIELSYSYNPTTNVLTLNDGTTTTNINLNDADAVIGNEVIDAANATLIRSGVGTAANPYKLGRAALTGDVTADAGSNATTVTAIRGKNVSATAPTSGQVLKFDGTNWAPAAVTTEAWGLNGNSIASTNFLGTTNSYPLIFKVNNIQGGRISNTAAGTTSIGYNALATNSGNYSTAVGNQALQNNTTTGTYNTVLGYNALNAHKTGNYNTAVGTSALQTDTTGAYNTAVGSSALYTNKSGANNTAVGYNALYTNSVSTGNTAVGYYALRATTGRANTAVGDSALRAVTTGTLNTAIGYQAGQAITTGSNNIAIGNAAAVNSATASDQLALGHFIYGVTGDTDANAKVGIGTKNPTVKLHINSTTNGALRYVDGTQAAGKVLTSDANGVGTWQTPITSVTFNGVITNEQNILFAINQSNFTRSTANNRDIYESQLITIIPNAYIDLSPGYWQIEVSLPMELSATINANEWLEGMIILTTNQTATDWQSATGSNGIAFAMIEHICAPVKASYINRGYAFGLLRNNTGTTQRYYLGFGRLNLNSNNGGGNAFFGTSLKLLPSGRNSHIFATSTNYVNQ
jgi:hypothetical protein